MRRSPATAAAAAATPRVSLVLHVHPPQYESVLTSYRDAAAAAIAATSAAAAAPATSAAAAAAAAAATAASDAATTTTFIRQPDFPRNFLRDSTPLTRGLSVETVLLHWDLISAIVTSSPPLPPHTDELFWRAQIARYGAYLAARNAAASEPFPDPPRPVYYVWLTHMLQPLAYRLDCLEAFSRIVPHNNHRPYFASDDSSASWTSSSLPAPAFPHVQWFLALDGLQSLVGELVADYPKIAARRCPLFLGKAILHYGKLMALNLQLGSTMLAPGRVLDLVWHTHQTTPVAYNALMNGLSLCASGDFFLDHNPCGETNPADPAWMRSTLRLWSKHLEEEVDEELFPPSASVMGGQGCGCCSLTEGDARRMKVGQALERALKLGEKAWNRSKLMLVGEGRAGKTALANALLGLPFCETPSTVGIESREVGMVVVGKSSASASTAPTLATMGGGGSSSSSSRSSSSAWALHVPPQSELTSALAAMVAADNSALVNPYAFAYATAASLGVSGPYGGVVKELIEEVSVAVDDQALANSRAVFSLYGESLMARFI